jgi:AcrR family transcriptional regulator
MVDAARDTKRRIMTTSGRLFQRVGYTGTGLKRIAAEAEAPFGSIYHFFPGGKQQLASEVVHAEGRMYRDLVVEVLSQADDPTRAMDVAFTAAAGRLLETDSRGRLPDRTLALEVASTNEPLRRATAEVFTDWIDTGVEWLRRWGYPEPVARRLAIGFIGALEGAFVLARALRSTEPLEAAKAGMLVAMAAESQSASASTSAPRSAPTDARGEP